VLRRAPPLLLAVWVLFGPRAVAAAQFLPTSEERPGALWGELAFHSGGQASAMGEQRHTVVSPLLAGRFHLIDRAELGFAWGFAHASVTVGTGAAAEEAAAFVIGNPALTGGYRLEGESFTLRLGLAIVIPVASVGMEDPPVALLARQTALAVASSARGWWNRWLWLPDRLTVVVPAARIDSGSGAFLWAAETALGIEVYTGEGEGTTDLTVQIAGEAGARLGTRVSLGGRLSLVWVITADGDNAQTALEPFLRYEAGALLSSLRFTVNLDRPAGFAFDRHRVWGVHLGGGARF